MNKAQVVKSLHAEQDRLRQEMRRVELALAAFGKTKDEPETPGRHVFRKRFKAVCVECQAPYTAKKSGTRFCSHRCAGKAWDKTNRPRVSQKTEPAQPQKARPVVLVAGDPLRAGR